MDSMFKAAKVTLGACLVIQSIINVGATIDDPLPVAADLGCYIEVPLDREFTVVAGNVRSTDVTPQLCRYSCARDGYKYAATQNGKFCFCGQTYGKHGTATGACTTPCLGDTSKTCGATERNNVYKAPNLVKDVAIMDIDKTLLTFDSSAVYINMSSGTVSSHALYFSDGTPDGLTSSSDVFLHAFREDGQKAVAVETSDDENNVVRSEEIVEVITEAKGIELTCPQYVPVNTQFECTLIVDRGSDLTASFNFDDGSEAVMYPGDTRESSVGVATGIPSAASHSHNVIFLMPNHVFSSNGTIMGFEYTADTPGSTTIQVYRPTCGTGQKLCFKSYTCISNTTSCRSQTNNWAKTCPAGSKYSIARRECVSITTGQTVDTFPYMGTGTFASLRFAEYAFVGEAAITVPSGGGVHFVSLPESQRIKVEAGDVMAVVKGPGAIEFENSPASYYENVLNTNGVGVYGSRATTGYSIKLGVTTEFATNQNIRHLVKAHFLKESCLVFQHNYTSGVNIYNMTVNVTNSQSDTLLDYALVDVQEPIRNVSYPCIAHMPTNDTLSFLINNHPGSSVVYTWTFDDGSVNVTSLKPMTHVFTQAGKYNISVTAENGVSQDTFWCETIIQDTILNLTLAADPIITIFTQPSKVLWNVTQGTDITYEVTVDGTTYSIGYADSLENVTAVHNGHTGSLDHIMSNIGNFSMTVNASNLISWQVAEIWFPVQITITNFRIIQPPVLPYWTYPQIHFRMDTGSHVQLDAVLDNSSTVVTFNETSLSGYVTVDTIALGTGPHNLSVTADNLLAPPPWTDMVLFYIDYFITNVTVQETHPICLEPGMVNVFNITMKFGSRFWLLVDYDDGGSHNSFHIEAEEGDLIQVNHTWAVEGNYTVNFTLSGTLNTVTIMQTYKVQNRVHSLTLTRTHPVQILPTHPGETGLRIDFLGGLIPTDTFFMYTFDDGDTFQQYLDISVSNPVLNYHNYTAVGTYNLTLNVSNCVSYMVLEKDIVVDEPVMELSVTADPRIHKFSDTVRLNVNMTWGSRMEVTWVPKDGTSNQSRSYSTYDETKYIDHVFSDVGIYFIDVFATNVHGTSRVTLTPPIIVQHPVRGFMVECQDKGLIAEPYHNVSLPCRLWQDRTLPFPTDANITVDYGDGTSVNWLLMDQADGSLTPTHRLVQRFKHPTGYTRSGVRIVNVRIENLVSSQEVNTSVKLFIGIVGLQKYVLSFENITNATIADGGIGTRDAYYPLEETILFRATIIDGSDVYYKWDFGNGDTATVFETANYFYQYDAPGNYNVTLNVSNDLDYMFLWRIIHVQRSCSDIGLWVNSPAPKNTTFYYQLDPGSIPTDACYFINFLDENSTDNKYWFMGNESQCIQSHPAEWADTDPLPRRFLPYTATQLEANAAASGGNRNITIEHIFQIINAYFVPLTVTNQVSNCSYTFRTGVTKGPCYWPYVNLEEPNKCINQQNCMNGIRSIRKSQTLFVYSSVRFNCTSTNRANYVWNVFKVNDDGTEYNYTSKIASDVVLRSQSVRTLKLPPRSLEYGTYRFLLNVSMHDELGIETLASCYIFVDKTPLEAGILGGSLVRIKWGTEYFLNALDFSSDPDAFEGNKTGLYFKMYCKRHCESWPPFSADGKMLSRSYTPCPAHEYIGSYSNDRGCFLDDGYNGPGPVPLPGDNYTDELTGRFPFDTTMFPESTDNITDSQVNLLIFVLKDTRAEQIHQTINLTLGDPPKVQIKCVSNCKTKLNPAGRFSLESKVEGWKRWIDYGYEWYLTKYTDYEMRRTTYGGGFWTNKASTGIVSDNMAIDSGAFIDINEIYLMNVKAWRKAGDTSNYGLSSREFRINEPPTPGVCYVTPKNGTSLETEFQVLCNQYFHDADGMAYYTIAYRPDSSQDWNWIYKSTEKPDMDEGSILPSGREDKDYWLEIVVRGYDNNGGYSDTFTSVQVLPASAAALDNILGSMDEPGGLIDTLTQNADPAAAGRTVGTIANVLNEETPVEVVEELPTPPPVDNSMSDAEKEAQQANYAKELLEAKKRQKEEENRRRDEKKKQRKQLISVMKSVEQVTLEDTVQVTGALGSLTDKPDEVSPEAAEEAANAVGKGVDMLADTVSSGAITADELEEASAPIINVIGNLISVVGLSGDESTDETSDCDIEGLSEEDKASCEAEEAAAKKDKQAEMEKNKATLAQLEAQVDGVSKACMKMKVAGESDTKIKTKSMQLNLGKKFTRDISNSAVSGGKGAKFTLPRADALFGNSNETTYFVETTVLRYEKNPYTFANQTDGKVKTQVTGLSMRNDTSGDVELKDLPDDFTINLPRSAESVSVTRLQNYTSPVGDKKKTTVHIIRAEPNAGLHLRVTPWINASTIGVNETDISNVTYDTDFSSYGKQWKVYIFVGRRPNRKHIETTFDYNCTLPLTIAQREELLERYELPVPSRVQTTQAPTTEATTTQSATDGTTGTIIYCPTVAATIGPSVTSEPVNHTTSNLRYTTYSNTTDERTTTGPQTVSNSGTPTTAHLRTTSGTTSDSAPETTDFFTTITLDTASLAINATLINGTTVNGTILRGPGTTPSDMTPVSGTLVDGALTTEDGMVGLDCVVLDNSVPADPVVLDLPEEEKEPEAPTLPDQNTCFLPPEVLALNTTTDVYVVIRHEDVAVTIDASDTGEGSNKKEEFVPALYDFAYYSSQCLYWDVDTDLWLTHGCRISPLTRVTFQQCFCNHLTAFGGGFAVPMNSIDLSDSAFTKLDENPIIFATMVCLMCMYVILCIWARRKDKKDAILAGVLPLVDNRPGDNYLYEITIYTGARKNAGTTAKIKLMVSGDKHETRPRLLLDDKRKSFLRGQADSFLMACPKALGSLQHCRIWHDNSGPSPGWYFSRMQITDLQTEKQYFFICDRWLAVEEDDGMVDRLVPVAGLQELTDFNHLFWKNTQKNLMDGHIWFSVFQRPAKSRFTRVQRLTCCLALLFSSMMANILFYKQGDVEGANPQVYRLGPISFTLSQIYVGIMSSLIVLPANLILVSIFRYAKAKPLKNEAKKEPTKTAERYRSATPVFDAKSELENQMDFLDTGDHNKRLMLTPDMGRQEPRSALSAGGVRLSPLYLQTDTQPISQPPVVTAQKEIPKDKGVKKKKFGLPWWSIYIGYFLALCIIGVAFWMTVEVAGVFGPEKSAQWLFSFCTSIVESIFLSQPIKVLIIALFYALIIRKPDVDEEERPSELKPDEELLRTDTDHLDPEIQKAMADVENMPLTLDQDYLKACREERLKEVKMWQIIREVIFYILFLYLLMMVAYGNRDPWSYHMYENFQNSLVLGSHDENSSIGSYSMEKIRNRESFWDWAENVMIPSLYAKNFYDGIPYSWMNGYTGDLQAYLIGSPRFRLHRIVSESCPYPINTHVPECRESYSMGNNDEDSYKMGWIPLNKSDPFDLPDQHWAYKQWDELDGFPFWGLMATYSGGGHVVELTKDRNTAVKIMAELKQHSWLDSSTRAIFIEFLAFNPNINLFGISQTVLEFTETGACFPYFKFHVMRLNRYVGTFMLVILISEVFTFLFIIYFLFLEIYKMAKTKINYFKDPWNVFEFITVAFCVSAVVLFFYRLFIGNSVSTDIHENPTQFHNFQYVVLWDEAYAILLGIIVTLANIKFTRLLRFNKRMCMLASTLAYASNNLLQFGIMFVIFFGAFAQVAYLMFNSSLADFSTFIRAAETLFASMLNKFDFYAMKSESRLWGPIIVFFFTLFVTFILINFFITIINEAFERVKHDVTKQSNDYEIVDFMMGRFKKYLGWGDEGQKSRQKKRGQNSGLPLAAMDYVGDTGNENSVEGLRLRVDVMMSKLESLIQFQTGDKEVMKELEKTDQGHKRPWKVFVSQ